MADFSNFHSGGGADFSAFHTEQTKKAPNFDAFHGEVERVRPSDPIKQAAASFVFDNLAGVANLGIGAFEGIKTAFDRDDDPDTNYLSELYKNFTTNSAAIKVDELRRSGRKHFFGVDDPSSLEDQAASLAGSLFLPGFGWLNTIAKSPSIGAKLFKLATPLVGIQKGKPLGNTLRVGGQLAVGGGIDQAIRLSHDEDSVAGTLLPVMTSEAAIKGVEVSKYDAAQRILHGKGTKADAAMFNGHQGQEINDLRNLSRADHDKKIQEAENDSLISGSVATLLMLGAAVFGKRRYDLVRKAAQDAGNELPTASHPVTDALNNIVEDPLAGIKKAAQDAHLAFNSSWVDSNAGLINMLKRASPELTDDQIVQMIGFNNADTAGMHSITAQTGEFPATGTRTTHIFADIVDEYDASSKVDQANFDTLTAYLSADMRRTRATVDDVLKKNGVEIDGDIRSLPDQLAVELRTAFDASDLVKMEDLVAKNRGAINSVRRFKHRAAPDLWGSKESGARRIVDKELKDTINNIITTSPQVYANVKRLHKTMDDYLDYATTRRVLDKDTIADWKRNITGSRSDDTAFAPLIQAAHPRSLWTRLINLMGINTREGKVLNEAAFLDPETLIHGQGVSTPVKALDAADHYMLQMMDFVNKNSARWQMASRIARVDVDADGVVKYHPDVDPKTLDMHYVGQTTFDSLPDNPVFVKGTFNSADEVVVKRMATRSGDTVGKFGDDLITIRRDGKDHVFYAPNHADMVALKMDTRLAGVGNNFLNYWKDVFVQFTTGRFSLFGPASAAYNQAAGSLNTMITEGFKAGGLQLVDSVRGTWKLFSDQAAVDIARITSTRILRDSMKQQSSPQTLVALNEMLQRRISNSMMRPFQRETGRLLTTPETQRAVPNITNSLRQSLPYIYDTYGANAVPMVGRMWMNLQTAMHEGAVFGKVLREADKRGGFHNIPKKEQGRFFRTAEQQAKNLVGDVQRRGTSPGAQLVHTAIPFAGATIQAWATLGRAILKNPKMTMPAIATIVGGPTVSEVVWNTMIIGDATYDELQPDGTTVKATYRDAYWRRLTTGQVIDNFLYFVPGVHPDNAVIYPLPPELSIMKAVLLEGMDAVMDLSGPSRMENEELGVQVSGRRYMHEALKRVTDLPNAPPVAALMSAATGKDVRISANIFGDETDQNTFGPFSSNAPGSSRITGGQSEVTHVGDEAINRVKLIINDLLGAGAGVALAANEAFHSGPDATTDASQKLSVIDRVGRGLDAGLYALNKTARYASPLTFGRTLSPNPNNNIARNLFAMKNTLEEAIAALKPSLSEGKVGKSGNLAIGNSLPSHLDPIYLEVGNAAPAWMTIIKPYLDNVATYREQKELLQNSNKILNLKTGEYEPASYSQIRERIDAYSLAIMVEQERQELTLKALAKDLSRKLNEKYNRSPDNLIDIDLARLKPRKNP